MIHGKSRRIKILIAAALTVYGVYTIIETVEDTSDFNKVIFPKRLNLSLLDVDGQNVFNNDQYALHLLPAVEGYYQKHVVRWRSQHYAVDVPEPFAITNANFWSFFPALNAWCPHPIERIGGIKWNWKWRGEGGKWVCGLNLFEQTTSYEYPCIVYSYGIEDDTSFESAILERTNCSVSLFDPTVDGRRTSIRRLLEKYPFRAKFAKVGLGSENFKGDEFIYRTLRSEMKQNHHKFIDILKIDIEGHEFATFKNILEDLGKGSLPFGQLQIEFHIPRVQFEKNLVLLDQFRNFYEALEKAGLRAFMAEPNPISSTKPHDNVRCYEYAFINLKSTHFILRNYTLPSMTSRKL